MITEITYNSAYHPSEEMLVRIRRSRQKASETPMREVHCPICGRWLISVPVGQDMIISARCHKCKLDGPLDTAYFRRRQQRHRRLLYYRKTK